MNTWGYYIKMYCVLTSYFATELEREKKKNESLLPEISTAIRKWAVRKPDAIPTLASSKSKTYHINLINKKTWKDWYLWQGQGKCLSVLFTIIKNPKPIKQLDKSPESYDLCEHIIDFYIHLFAI